MNNLENVLRGIIIASFLSTEDKNEVIEYFEELLEKANRYDDLCK